ncbi:hypothetical protein F9L02_19470 [Brucella intermedia]|nr:hypothetical protein F9L02_19470 [Brucella intermedia]
MIIESVVELKWLDAEHTILGGTVVTADLGTIPVCIRDNYDTAEGQLLWDEAHAGRYGPIAEYVAPSDPTPEEKRAIMPNLTARQLRLGLLSLGKLDGVPTAISALPSPDKEQAEIEWQYASEFRRLHPLIVQLIPILGLTDDQVDTVWLEFAQV